MQYDGILFIRQSNSTGNLEVYVNDIHVSIGGTNNSGGWGTLGTININNGDSVYMNIASVSNYTFAMYYKLRDYSGRT